MKVDANIGSEMNRIPSEAKRLEDMGYSGLRIAEGPQSYIFSE